MKAADRRPPASTDVTMTPARLCLLLLLGVVATSGQCPDGWTQFSDTCYIVNGTDPVIATDLASACSSLHSDAMPASVHSEEENAMLYSLTDGHTDTWIGLSRTSGGEEFVWADGTVANYTNWSPAPKHGDYVTMYFDDGTWGAISSGFNQPFSCQLPASI